MTFNQEPAAAALGFRIPLGSFVSRRLRWPSDPVSDRGKNNCLSQASCIRIRCALTY